MPVKKLGFLLVIALLISLLAPIGGAIAALPEDGSYIVKLKEPAANETRLFSSIDAYEISGDAGFYRVDSLEDIAALGDRVEYFEPDTKAYLLALTNDKYSSYQWNLEHVGVAAAWNKDYSGNGVRVAIIDSGINSMHEDFEGTVFEKGTNIIDGSHDVTDDLGHGTFIAGTLAAIRNNSKGIAGLCDEITIIPIKCFGDDVVTDASYVIRSIYEAIDTYNCDVINISNGITRNLASMREAIEYADSKGVLIIAAAGNQGKSDIYYPAGYDSVIGVGAVDQNGIVADFSQRNNSVFVAAPGVDLVGIGHEADDQYVPKTRGSGTSYAAPHVVAAAVFLKELNPNANSGDLKDILITSSIDAGTRGFDTSYGHGILNIAAFIEVMETYEFTPIYEVFPDLAGHWALDFIDLCVDRGYFNGVSANRFEPETTMSRAMFVTVLGRMSGETINGYFNNFTDVPDGEYYTKYAAWGSASGIVQGVGEGIFNPNDTVTREQMAVFLYRFALAYNLTKASAGSVALNSFSDQAKVSGYAREALAWAVENGLINGTTTNTLSPQNGAKRCEVAAIIARFTETVLA